ncbi:MAG: hypothetical protein WAM60_20405 [Candidatus Promineifilaceae bacterium]
MAEIIIQILTGYREVDGDNWPAVWVDYPPQSGTDRTGIRRPPPSPNTIVVECGYETAVLSQITADPRYGLAAILWQADEGTIRPVDVPNAAEFAALRAKLVALGWRTVEIDAAIGTVVNGRSRAELAEAMIGWLRGNEQERLVIG